MPAITIEPPGLLKTVSCKAPSTARIDYRRDLLAGYVVGVTVFSAAAVVGILTVTDAVFFLMGSATMLALAIHAGFRASVRHRCG